MQNTMVGAQVESPIPGKMKNCNEWAYFETVGSSSTAALCHGGRYDGKMFQPCPARLECRNATIQRNMQPQAPQHQRQLPLLNPQAMGNQLRQLRPIVSQTANQGMTQAQGHAFRPMSFGASTLPSAQGPQGMPRTQPGLRNYESTFPQPIIPPDDYPESMRTPYASATTVYGGGTSPTFLPQSGENIFERLIKNMMQGALSACGWHVFDYTRTVDIFR